MTVSTWRGMLLRCLAITSLVPAVIHFAVAGEHFQEFWLFGVLMLVAAWLQLASAIGLVARPSRTVVALGAALNAGVLTVYVITRTVGDVVGPTPHSVEPVGFGDLFCTVCEGLLVIGALVLLLWPLARPVSKSVARGGSVAVAALALVLLSASLVDGGPEMVMSMGGDPAAGNAASISLPTTSPAGAITMPQPTMQMAPGMQMVDASCTATPTAAQESAAVSLVNRSWADAKKYQSLAVAKAAGFRPLTPTGRPVVHYLDPASYRHTEEGGPAIDPTAPQSLVYANTPRGAVLAAAMFIESPRASGTPPDPGGCLTQWHVHTNLCFRGLRVVGVTDPTCPAGSRNRQSPPMLHVWFVPIPGGPTAVDATDAQVRQAAEQVSSPLNGTA
ncbi:MAG: hypothetical protein ACREQM_12120 [Candidatus Dormibacteraceae bacterium]